MEREINDIPLPSTSFMDQLMTQEVVAHDHHLLASDNSNSNNIDWVSLLSSSFNYGNYQQLPSLIAGSCSSDQYQSIMARNGGDDHDHQAVSNNGNDDHRNRYIRGRKVTPPRVAFHTRSVDDILDDGYRWRKYGQKAVKNSRHPRSYYRCTHHTCNVKKQIQRLANDSSIVVTTYEGIHNHLCEKLMETLSPLLKQLQFLSGI